MVRMRVLGAVELAIGSRRIGMNTESLFALALYLSVRAGERVSREDLLSLFWTKGTEAQQRHALRQMLYRLRQKGCSLDKEGDWVRLDAARVDSDLRTALSAEWIEQATAAQVDAAAQFMPTFSRKMAPNFVAWLDEIRELLSSQHRKAAHLQIVVARREGRWSDLERWAQAVLRTDPLNEEATLARAESAAMAGSKTIAMEILDTYLMEVGEISDELGKPALALRKRLAERRPDWSYRGPKEVALVGRTELMSRLTGLVEAAWKGDGSAVVLVGAPGIGKTRLAMETRAYAELKGMRTVVVRAEAGNSERPLALAMALMPELIQLPGAAGTDPSALEFLRRMSKLQSKPEDSFGLGHDSLRGTLIAALEEVVAAISSETRLLVLIDDVHNADAESLPILAALSRRTKGRRVAWIATSRDSGNQPKYRELTDGSYSAYRVLPLSSNESRQLVEAVLDAHQLHLSDDAIGNITRVSGGNPLFARELGAHRASTRDETSTPQTLKDLMSDRVGRLSDEVVRLLRIISLLEGCATVGRVRALAGSQVQHFSTVVESLEAEGLLTMGDGGLILHESWRQHIQASLTGATRAFLCHECAHVLTDDSQGAGIEEWWRAADLLAAAGETAEAFRYFLRSADEMLRLGLPDDAASVLSRAISSSRTTEQQLAVRRRLAEANHARGDLGGVLTATEGLLDPSWRSHSESALTELIIAICHRADALAKSHVPVSIELAWLEQVAKDSLAQPKARHFACYTGIRRSVFAENRALVNEFYKLAVQSTDVDGDSLASLLVRLVHAAELGSVSDVLDAEARLATVSLEGESLTFRCNSLRFRAVALRMAGEITAAHRVGTEAFVVAMRFRQREIAANTSEMMSFLALDNENTEEAARWIEIWRENGGGGAHPMRDKGLRHAELRLALQLGEYSTALPRLKDQLESAKSDPVETRRAGEIATTAFAAAMSQEPELARALIDEIEPRVSALEAEFLLDFPMEMIAKTLTVIGEHARCARLKQSYIKKRLASFPRPLPKFYRELRPDWDAATTLMR